MASSKKLTLCSTVEQVHEFFVSIGLEKVAEAFKGEFNRELFKKNIRSAINQCIGLVDKTPAMKTQINLFSGQETSHHLKRRPKLLTFLKGTQTKREQLRTENPALFAYFSKIWALKERHQVTSVIPGNYMFMLAVCGQSDCIHPHCLNGASDPSWYPGGPSVFSVLPTPVAEAQKDHCHQCVDKECFGHYKKEPADRNTAEVAPVPSVLINEEFSRDPHLSPTRAKEIGKKALVDPADLTFQWKHLEQVKINRLKGVQKAKKTRAAKKKKVSKNVLD